MPESRHPASASVLVFRSRTRALGVVLSAAALGLPACQGDLDTGSGAESASAASVDDFKVAEKIVGGRVETGYPAVGALLTADGGLCTGTVVAKRWVLTAAHCVEGGLSGAVFAFGNSVDAPTRVVQVNGGQAHPQYDADRIVNDIALVRLASDAPVAPLPMAGSLAGTEGESLTFVGFGVTSGRTDDSGTKRSVVIPLAELDATTFMYTVRGRNTCSGDSGGPAFLQQNGVAVVAGVTSYGDASCRQYGVDTRVDVYRGWIDPIIGAASPAPQPEPPAAADPCGGLSYLGECQGTMARWCEDGQIKQNDCARSQQACGYVDDQVGYYCTAAAPAPIQQTPPAAAPDGCGDVDYLGQCAGRVAQWCEGGRLVERNCASFGQACGYVNASVGYYCR
jgi:hypothetical protein